MNEKTLKHLLFIIVMLVLVALAFSTDNFINSKLYLSIALIFGAISFQTLLTQKQINNEQRK
jgi:hypothetical protein